MGNRYELPKWERPTDYGGFNPVGDFVIYTRNRDSGILETVNSEVIENIFSELNYKFREEWYLHSGLEAGEENWFYIFRAGHWAVGWVEYLMRRKPCSARTAGTTESP